MCGYFFILYTFYAMWAIRRYIYLAFRVVVFHEIFCLMNRSLCDFFFCFRRLISLSEGNMTFWILCSLVPSDNGYRELSVRVYFLKNLIFSTQRFFRKRWFIGHVIHRNRRFTTTFRPFLLIVHPCRSYRAARLDNVAGSLQQLRINLNNRKVI